MITQQERIKYLVATAEILNTLCKKSVSSLDNFAEVAKKMNVASAYKIENTMGALAENISCSSNDIIKSAVEAVAVIGKSNFNGGEFDTLIKSSIAAMEESIPSRFSFAKVNESADGNEDLSSGVITQMDESLQAYSLMSRTALLEVSDAASKVRGDDHALVNNIGRSVETLTNNIIEVNNKILTQVEAMVSEYKITLASIDDITSGLVSKVSTLSNADISTGNMDI